MGSEGRLFPSLFCSLTYTFFFYDVTSLVGVFGQFFVARLSTKDSVQTLELFWHVGFISGSTSQQLREFGYSVVEAIDANS